MKWVRRLVVFLAVILILAAGLLLLIRTSYAKSRIASYLQQILAEDYGLRMEIGTLDYELSPLVLRAGNFRLYGGKNNDQPFLTAESIEVHLPYSSLWSDDFHVTRLTVAGPLLVAANLPQPRIPEKSTGTFRVDELVVEHGSLTYGEWKARDLQIMAKADSNGVTLNQLRVSVEGTEVTAKGTLRNFDNPEYQFNYTAIGDARLISRLSPKVPKLAGAVNTDGEISGKGPHYTVKGAFESPSLSDASSGPFSLSGNYGIDLTNQQAPYQISLRWKNLSLAAVKAIAPDIPQIAAFSEGNLNYLGGLDPWRSTGDFQISLIQNREPGIPLSGILQGKLADRRIFLQPGTITTGGSKADFTGSLDVSSLSLILAVDVPSLSDLRPINGELPRFPGAITFNGTLAGSYADLKAAGTVTATSPKLFIKATGQYFVASERMSLNFEGNAQSRQTEASGEIRFSGSAQGAIFRPVIRASLSGEGLQAGGIDIGKVTGSAASDGRLLRLDAEIPRFATVLHTKYAFPGGAFELEGSFRDISPYDFQKLMPQSLAGLTGKITGSVKASGNADHPKDAEATLVIENAELTRNEIQVQIAQGSSVHLTQRTLQVDVSANTLGSTVVVYGRVPTENSRELALQVLGETDLKNLRLVTNEVEATGPATFDVQVDGTLSDPVYSGTLSVPAFDLRMPSRSLELTNASASAELDTKGIHLQAKGLLNGVLTEVSGVLPQGDTTGSIHLSVTDSDLSRLSPQLLGSANLTLDASGKGTELDQWTGFAELRTSDVTLGETRLETIEPLRLELQKGIVALKPARVRAADRLELTASGQIDLISRKLSVTAQTQTDLSLISRFVPELEASGQAAVNLSVTGSVDAPEVNGLLTAHTGLLRIQGYPFLMENIEIQAPVTKGRLVVQQLSASIGGGQISGGGTIQLQGKQAGQMSLWAKARNVGSNYPEGFRSQMNADLTLSSAGNDFLLKGEIAMLRSAYQEKIDPDTQLLRSLLSQKKALAPEQTFAHRIKLQLDLRTVDDLLVENNLAQIRASAQLQITGSAYQPRFSGRTSVRQGSKLTYRGITYKVTRGNVDFVGKQILQPELDVTLEADVQEPTVQGGLHPCAVAINVNGPMENVTWGTKLEGCDTLTEENTISFLLFGETEPLSAGGRRHIVQQHLAAMLAGQLFSGIQERIGKAIGLDFEPQLLISEGDPTARLTLGKQLNEQLHLTYSLDLSKSNEQTWIVQYQPGRNFSMRFVDESDGTYTGTMNHTILLGKASRERISNVQPSAGVHIGKIDIVNDTNLPDSSLQTSLGTHPGDTFDFWALRQKIDHLKQELQRHEYLFPAVDAQETEVDNTHTALTIRISGQGVRRMVFSGFDVTGDRLSRYRQWWREGLSEASVLQQITDDLQRLLWQQGYYKASVKESTESRGTSTVYGFAISPGPKTEQVSFSFHGAHAISEQDLKKRLLSFYDSERAMAVEAIHLFPAFKQKILALYAEQGFLETKVKTTSTSFDTSSAGIAQEVQLEEGPRSTVEDVIVSGCDPFPADLTQHLKLRKGTIYLPLALPDDELTISDYYSAKGYLKFQAAVEVEKPQKNSPALILHYHIDTGEPAHVTWVRITGNRITRRGLIEDRLSLKGGDLLTPEVLAQAQKRLYDLGVFERVLIHAEELNTPGDYDVTVELAERKNMRVTYGLRYASEQHLEGEAQFTNSNLLGAAQTLSLYGKTLQNEKLYRFFYQAPYLLGWKWDAFFVATQENIADPFLENTTLSFQQKTTLTRSFSLLNSVSYRRNHTTFYDPIFDETLDFNNNLVRLMTTFVAEMRDDPINAKHGSFLSAELEYSPSFLGSYLTFVKTYVQFFHYQPISRILWASGVRVGLAKPLEQRRLFPTDRFFAGGSDTLRGFHSGEISPIEFGLPLGGDSVFILNQELRVPLHRWIDGVVFYDGGNVYDRLQDFSLKDLRHSAGFGFRVVLPYGILGRFDWGFNLSPRKGESGSVIHFTFGQIF